VLFFILHIKNHVCINAGVSPCPRPCPWVSSPWQQYWQLGGTKARQQTQFCSGRCKLWPGALHRPTSRLTQSLRPSHVACRQIDELFWELIRGIRYLTEDASSSWCRPTDTGVAFNYQLTAIHFSSSVARNSSQINMADSCYRGPCSCCRSLTQYQARSLQRLHAALLQLSYAYTGGLLQDQGRVGSRGGAQVGVWGRSYLLI